MKSNYIKSIEESLYLFEKNSKKFDFIIEQINKNMKNPKGRVIFLATNQIGNFIKTSIDSFDYLFKFSKNKFNIIISGEYFENIDKEKRKELENNKSVGVISAIENNITKNDVIIGFTATGKTNYVNSFMKESNEKGATTILITSSSTVEEYPFIDKQINLFIKNKTINGLYIGNHTTMLKISFELITFSFFERIGQIYNNDIMTMKIWTKKFRFVSYEIIRKYEPNITDKKIEELIEETNGELSIILTMIKLKLDFISSKKIVEKNKYNFMKIFK